MTWSVRSGVNAFIRWSLANTSIQPGKDSSDVGYTKLDLYDKDGMIIGTATIPVSLSGGVEVQNDEGVFELNEESDNDDLTWSRYDVCSDLGDRFVTFGCLEVDLEFLDITRNQVKLIPATHPNGERYMLLSNFTPNHSCGTRSKKESWLSDDC